MTGALTDFRMNGVVLFNITLSGTALSILALSKANTGQIFILLCSFFRGCPVLFKPGSGSIDVQSLANLFQFI